MLINYKKYIFIKILIVMEIDVIIRIIQGHQIEIDELKDRISELEAKLSYQNDRPKSILTKTKIKTSNEYYYAKDYGNKLGMRMNSEEIKKIEVAANKICKKNSIKIKSYSLREGGFKRTIKIYPESVLKEVFRVYKLRNI